jgi:hypothetical protein
MIESMRVIRLVESGALHLPWGNKTACDRVIDFAEPDHEMEYLQDAPTCGRCRKVAWIKFPVDTEAQERMAQILEDMLP